MNPSTLTDPTAELRDIRPAIEIPDPAGWPLWATLALVALGLAIAGFLWWRWRVSKRAAVSPDPVRLALAELDAARSTLESADAETYAMAVSNVLRRFIEQRFQIAAARQTSEEFLLGLTARSGAATPAIGQAHRSVLRDFLRQCDLVKFARGQLDRAQRESLHEVAKSFIQTSAEQPHADSNAAAAPPAESPTPHTISPATAHRA